uniref:Homing endonuclease n=1 Tax=Fusarium brevicatenulatum TaxID=48488 RepID=A0A6M4AZH4_9HYPO|nr:homing endonuclease [Fusarium brevicatenulatum]
MKTNNDGCFQLKQRIHTNLFEAFKLVFNTSRKIDTSFSLRSHNNFNQFGVRSFFLEKTTKSDIQTVINFFSFEGLHPLIGLKYIQYMKWLSNLQNSMRYSKLHYPKL